MTIDEPIRFDYPLHKDSLVWDCGGYEGKFSEIIWWKFQCNIVVFEPVPEYAHRIAEKFRAIPKITVIPMAIGRTNDDITIHLANNSTGAFANGEARVVPQIEIADVLKEIRVDIDLLKLNIEGAEYEVLESLLETGLIQRFKNIQVQFHAVAPDSEVRCEQIQDALKKTHEIQWDKGACIWQSWRRKYDHP